MIFDGFIGPSYTSASLAWDAQRAVNLYLEADESGAGKSNRALLGCPGTALYATLPTSPVRGIWTGLIDNLPGTALVDQIWVVSGSKLYQVFQNGTVDTSGTAVTWKSGGQFSAAATYTGLVEAGAKLVIGGTTYTVASVTDATHLTLTSSAGTQTGVAFSAYFTVGDVGDDATHTPAMIVPNGSQILVSSAGLAWIVAGNTVSQCFFNNGRGVVDTVGTAATWVSGDQFDVTLVGSAILIAGVSYVVSAFVDTTHITLGSSAGSQTGAAFSLVAAGGTVNTSGTAVSRQSGDFFTGMAAGAPIVIGTTLYTIASITDASNLVLTATAGTQSNVVYSAPKPVLASMIAFIDTYFVALPANSKAFYLSASNDGSVWSPLDFARKEGFPDAIGAVLADHEELWLFGSETTEVWRDTGNADFPLQRDPGAFIHQGIRAPFSAVNLANGVAWIGGDARGNAIAWRASGYTPARVSTHAVETAWASYSTVSDATAYVHVLRGHQFWVINFPTANATWVYDATAGTWHERAWWNGASLDRHRGGTHGYAFNKHFLGDWQTGAIYDYSEAYFSDAGTEIHYIRTAPHLTNEELWSFYARLRIAMQAGPAPTLAWSDDLGVTFTTDLAGSARLIGTSSQQSAWRRLGKGRDRIYRMTIISTTQQVALIAAYVDVEAGGA